jgi:hypothetical protein
VAPPPPPSGSGRYVWSQEGGWEPERDEGRADRREDRQREARRGRRADRRGAGRPGRVELPARIEEEQLLLALRILTQESPEAREMLQEIHREMQQLRALMRLRESF